MERPIDEPGTADDGREGPILTKCFADLGKSRPEESVRQGDGFFCKTIEAQWLRAARTGSLGFGVGLGT